MKPGLLGTFLNLVPSWQVMLWVVVFAFTFIIYSDVLLPKETIESSWIYSQLQTLYNRITGEPESLL